MTDWSQAQYIFVVRPTCPRCGSLRYSLIRSEANGDGSVTRKAICKFCGLAFKIVAELPELGNGHLPTA